MWQWFINLTHPRIYYQCCKVGSGIFFDNLENIFYLANKTRYIDSDVNSRSSSFSFNLLILEGAKGRLPPLKSNFDQVKKIKFFNFISNFDQATQKKLKKLSYMAKLISKMPKIMAPIWCPKQMHQSMKHWKRKMCVCLFIHPLIK